MRQGKVLSAPDRAIIMFQITVHNSDLLRGKHETALHKKQLGHSLRASVRTPRSELRMYTGYSAKLQNDRLKKLQRVFEKP